MQVMRGGAGIVGSILAWQGNLIHFGAACGPEAQQPRKSIAMTFRRAEHAQYQKIKAWSREETRCADLADRLQLCAMGLLLYSHWFPDFPGLPWDVLVSQATNGVAE